jgi:hypothetical protein
MPQEDGLGVERHRLLDDFLDRHRSELGVQELDRVSGVEQGASDGEQPERRQVLARDAASDRRVWGIDQQDAHRLRLFLRMFGERDLCSSNRTQTPTSSKATAFKRQPCSSL